jgi:hypothetical protein
MPSLSDENCLSSRIKGRKCTKSAHDRHCLFDRPRERERSFASLDRTEFFLLWCVKSICVDVWRFFFKEYKRLSIVMYFLPVCLCTVRRYMRELKVRHKYRHRCISDITWSDTIFSRCSILIPFGLLFWLWSHIWIVCLNLTSHDSRVTWIKSQFLSSILSITLRYHLSSVLLCSRRTERKVKTGQRGFTPHLSWTSWPLLFMPSRVSQKEEEKVTLILFGSSFASSRLHGWCSFSLRYHQFYNKRRSSLGIQNQTTRN